MPKKKKKKVLHWKATFIEQDLRKLILKHNLVPFKLIFNYYQSRIICFPLTKT